MRSSGFVLAVSVALSVTLGGCATWYAHPLPETAKVHRAKTQDGWEIALVQYLPEGTPTGRPVLLSHGISANGRHMDLDEQYSLARWLAARGRETWVISIRGTGLSDRINAEKGRKGGYSFDTVWQQDTRAAIAYVRANAATPKLIARARRDGAEVSAALAALETQEAPLIDYVGHSMGGMLIYAYLSQGGDGLNAVVTLGSPTRLDWGGAVEPWAIDTSEPFFDPEGVIPMESLALLSMPWQGRMTDTPLSRLLYNPENSTPEAWRRLIAIGTGDISTPLGKQLAAVVKTGAFASADGTVDYRREMKKIRVPVLVVAGKVDRIATPAAVKDGYRALGGPKEWILAAEENGFQADYGHMDYLIGQRAHTELWPRVLRFMDSR